MSFLTILKLRKVFFTNLMIIATISPVLYMFSVCHDIYLTKLFVLTNLKFQSIYQYVVTTLCHPDPFKISK